jgi:hypothetical protein
MDMAVPGSMVARVALMYPSMVAFARGPAPPLGALRLSAPPEVFVTLSSVLRYLTATL